MQLNAVNHCEPTLGGRGGIFLKFCKHSLKSSSMSRPSELLPRKSTLHTKNRAAKREITVPTNLSSSALPPSVSVNPLVTGSKHNVEAYTQQHMWTRARLVAARKSLISSTSLHSERLQNHSAINNRFWNAVPVGSCQKTLSRRWPVTRHITAP